MKRKLILTLALMACIGGLSAQQKDGFFSSYNQDETRDTNISASGTQIYNTQDVPLGSGLVAMTLLGAGYAVMRNRRKEEAK